jgi:hypothetical protein
MRIVSQDRCIDIDYNKTIIIRLDGSILYQEYSNDFGIKDLLGTYKTEERALEVMEEIRKYYASSKAVDLISKEFIEMVNDRNICDIVVEDSYAYFYMPKD